MFTNWFEIRRNKAINKVRKAFVEGDIATLNKYPASFVLGVRDGQP